MLGVGASADPDEVRAAYGRLTRRLDPRQGGSAELQRIVRASYDALSQGGARRAALPTVDPYLLFELKAGADSDAVKVAYRRLAAVVHPDRGGTDELFRIVGAAYDALIRPHVPTGPRAQWASWAAREPWPRPRPERPYRPPPEDARFHAPGWRDWAGVVAYVGALAFWFGLAAVIVVLFGAARGPDKLFPGVLMPAWAVAFSMHSRTIISGLLRALARARSSYARQRRADPEAFLADQCLDSPVNRESEEILYAAYAGWCRQHAARPLSRWVFIEKLRTLGLLHVQASTMDHGLFVGVRLRVR